MSVFFIMTISTSFVKIYGMQINTNTNVGKRHTGFWVGKPEGGRPLGRPRRRRQDNITIYLQKIEWWGIWTGLVWLRNRCAGCFEGSNGLSAHIKCGEYLE
jgi:hypothetical protein